MNPFNVPTLIDVVLMQRTDYELIAFEQQRNICVIDERRIHNKNSFPRW